LRYEYPEEIVPPGETAASWLRKLVERGLASRYGMSEASMGHERAGNAADAASLLRGDSAFRCTTAPANVRALIEHELALIAELGYEPYFLTVQDIVAFARSKTILCQGRGSAANSAVCYALHITEVDPARMQMLFERFISRSAADRPISTSTSSTSGARRGHAVRLRKIWPRPRSDSLRRFTVPASAVRDVGRAFGLDLTHSSTGWPAYSRGGTASPFIATGFAKPGSIPTIR
jgi:error-prone DNA polymerase